MPRPKATNPRNQHRGTKLTQFRFRDETLAELASIAAHLSAQAGGATITKTDAARLAIAEFARKLRDEKTAKTK